MLGVRPRSCPTFALMPGACASPPPASDLQLPCGKNEVLNVTAMASSLFAKNPRVACKACPEGTVALFPSLACTVSRGPRVPLAGCACLAPCPRPPPSSLRPGYGRAAPRPPPSLLPLPDAPPSPRLPAPPRSPPDLPPWHLCGPRRRPVHQVCGGILQQGYRRLVLQALRGRQLRAARRLVRVHQGAAQGGGSVAGGRGMGRTSGMGGKKPSYPCLWTCRLQVWPHLPWPRHCCVCGNPHPTI
jgi:hypothetical protein